MGQTFQVETHRVDITSHWFPICF